jgi:hypothetical protein
MAEAEIVIIDLLKRCMERSGKYGDRHEILVNILLDGDGFIASSDFLSVFSSDFGKSLASMRVLNSCRVIYTIPLMVFFWVCPLHSGEIF